MKKLINNETEIAAKVHNTLDNVSLNKNYSEATSPNVSQVTTKEIYPGIFMAPINLPRNPLRSINNYIVKGQSRDLMVDTALTISWPKISIVIRTIVRPSDIFRYILPTYIQTTQG